MSASASFQPACAKRRRKIAVHHAAVAARSEMCSDGTLRMSWSRHINMAAKAWQATAPSLKHISLHECTDRRGVIVNVSAGFLCDQVPYCDIGTQLYLFFRPIKSLMLVHSGLTNVHR
jgi:hypothetical protein